MCLFSNQKLPEKFLKSRGGGKGGHLQTKLFKECLLKIRIPVCMIIYPA